eukprot:PhF_6_TR6263/c0_g1_i1/m.9475
MASLTSVLQNSENLNTNANRSKHLVVRVKMEKVTLDTVLEVQRPDVASVTIQCDVDEPTILMWDCGARYVCVRVHSDTKNVTIAGCSMNGGIQAFDPDLENSTMTLTIRDGNMDGYGKERLVNIVGVRNVNLWNMTIRNGKAPLGENGGCVLLYMVEGNITIINSTVYNCFGYSRGGCFMITGNVTSVGDIHSIESLDSEQTYVSFRNSILHHCQASYGKGGAVYISSVRVLDLAHVMFLDSAALFEGGCLAAMQITLGIFAVNVTTRNCLVINYNNQGGCWAVMSRQFVLTESLLDNCSTGWDGGGIRLVDSE